MADRTGATGPMSPAKPRPAGIVAVMRVPRLVLPVLVPLALVLASCSAAGTAEPSSTAPTSVAVTTAAPATNAPVTVPTLSESPSTVPVTSTGSSTRSTTVKSTPATSAPETSAASSTPETTEEPPSTTETTEVPATTPVPTTEPSTTTPSTSKPSTSKPPTTKPPTSKPSTTRPSTPSGSMTKKTVVVDPGHNGANGANPDVINQLVDAGFGEVKACNTTGTSTNDGYTEATFNWKVANLVKANLEAKGITVIMTRDSNDGVGPCVDKRAAVGNDNGVDAVLSIHGDGSAEGDRGFYVMTAERHPASEEIAAESDDLAVDVRDELVGAGLSPANYLGSDGLWTRSDLAGLNLSLVPTVMVEMGNMRDSADSALMTSDSGQAQIAQGLANGVVQYLISGG